MIVMHTWKYGLSNALDLVVRTFSVNSLAALAVRSPTEWILTGG